MNTFQIEMFLIGMIVSSLTFFIYFGNRLIDFLKIPDSPKLKQRMQNFDLTKLEIEKMRRKIESKPTIICSLPIHQVSRPEAPLF